MAAVVLVGGGRCVRWCCAEKAEEGKRSRGREEVQGVPGVSRRAAGLAGTLPARSRRWRPPSTRVRLRLCLLAEEDDERGGKWAGPSWAGPVGPPGKWTR